MYFPFMCLHVFSVHCATVLFPTCLNSGSFSATELSKSGCVDVYDFMEACKAKLQLPNPPQDLSLSADGNEIEAGAPLPSSNTCSTPLSWETN